MDVHLTKAYSRKSIESKTSCGKTVEASAFVLLSAVEVLEVEPGEEVSARVDIVLVTTSAPDKSTEFALVVVATRGLKNKGFKKLLDDVEVSTEGLKKLLDDVEAAITTGMLLVVVNTKTSETLDCEHPGVPELSWQYLSTLIPSLQLSQLASQAWQQITTVAEVVVGIALVATETEPLACVIVGDSSPSSLRTLISRK